MLYVDLISDEEEVQSPTSLRDLCHLFEMPDPFLPPSSVPLSLETPESPVAGVMHPMDVCPILSPVINSYYSIDTDLRGEFFYQTDPVFDPLPSPVYTPQELDAALSFLPPCSCPDHYRSDHTIRDLRQRLDSIEQQYQARMTSMETLVNTFAVDLATLTQGVNQQLSHICDLLQERHDHNFAIHRHTGDILASLACLPALDLRMTSGISSEIQALRRRTLYG